MGKWGKGAPGALVTSADDSATSWGPQAKKQWAPVCKKHWHNLSSFPPSPSLCICFSLSPSLALSIYLSCSFVLPLTGREQGMLIKGCENQEKKRRAHRDTEGKDSRQTMVCVSIGNRAEIERLDLWQKQGPGNERQPQKERWKTTTLGQ